MGELKKLQAERIQFFEFGINDVEIENRKEISLVKAVN